MRERQRRHPEAPRRVPLAAPLPLPAVGDELEGEHRACWRLPHADLCQALSQRQHDGLLWRPGGLAVLAAIASQPGSCHRLSGPPSLRGDGSWAGIRVCHF